MAKRHAERRSTISIDLLNGLRGVLQWNVPSSDLATFWYVYTFYAPLVLVSHLMIFAILVKSRSLEEMRLRSSLGDDTEKKRQDDLLAKDDLATTVGFVIGERSVLVVKTRYSTYVAYMRSGMPNRIGSSARIIDRTERILCPNLMLFFLRTHMLFMKHTATRLPSDPKTCSLCPAKSEAAVTARRNRTSELRSD